MKNQRNTALLARAIIIIMVLISGCSKEDEVAVPPSITVMDGAEYVSGDTSIAAGENIRLKVMMEKGSQSITNFTIDVYDSENHTYFDTGMNTSYLMWEGSFFKTLAPVEEWTFTVRDRDGNANSTSFTIHLDTNSTYQPLQLFSSIDLGAQDNVLQGGIFGTSNQNIYFNYQANNDTNIQKETDLLYYYSEEDKNTIASPGANIEDGIFAINPADWTIVNTTRYYKTTLTSDDFISAVNDSIILANYDEGGAKRKAKNLQANEIYTFKTQGGKLGMFMVNEVAGTTEGSVNIDLKIQ